MLATCSKKNSFLRRGRSPDAVMSQGGREESSARGAALSLHRVRFVDWSPSSIAALAFSPVPPAPGGSASIAGAERSVLAVGRDNGNIDLCTWCEDTHSGSLAKGWILETTLLGDINYKIEALAFTHNAGRLRLFSTSGGSILTEHYLPPALAAVDGVPVSVPTAPTRTLSSQGGAIWSLAASPLGRYLAIGCEDGVVRLIDVADNAFEHATRSSGVAPRMTRVATRIMSLAWGPPRRRARPAATDSDDEDEDMWEETFLLGGLGNSAAALWDIESGALRSRLTVLKNRSEHTIVWAVGVLADGTLVTGDSTGRVTFFDARTRVPLPGATFQCHTAGADVLTLCVGSDGRSVYSAGVDQKVVEYTHVGGTWAPTATRRLHAHDIRSLAMDPPFVFPSGGPAIVNRIPVLVSGGLDFHIVLTPAAPASQAWRAAPRARDADTNPVSSSASTSFADTTQRRLAYVPPAARCRVVAVAPERRWIVLRRETSVGIWALGEAPWRKVTELELRVRSNLGAVAVSADGRFLAASDLYETKLFELMAKGDAIVPRRVRSLGVAVHGTDLPAPGASALAFSPDGTRLVLCSTHGAFVHVIQLPVAARNAVLLKTFSQHRQRRVAGADDRVLAGSGRGASAVAQTPLATDAKTREVAATVVLADVSPDGQWLVTADSARRMHVFHLDTLSHQRVLPSPASVPNGTAFHPHQPSLLAVALPTNHVAFYDLDVDSSDAMHMWEQGVRAELDAQLGKIREPVVGCVWVPAAGGATLVLYGPSWLCTARQAAQPMTRKKRRSGNDEAPGAWSVRTTFRYQPLLHVDALSGSQAELLVLERPYFALAQTLPPAFYRGAKYGM